jgi:hypothetical protein
MAKHKQNVFLENAKAKYTKRGKQLSIPLAGHQELFF